MKVSNNKRHYLWFFSALTALDILGTDNDEEVNTCGLQYPYLPGGTVGYPAHPRLIRLSVRQSVCPLISLLIILRKIY
jgi:hypothetical protein